MPETNFSLQDLADMVGLSAWHFLRQFKKYVGLPPHAWLVQARLQKARQLLKQGDQIAMVAQQCGFSDQSHFNRHFKKSNGRHTHSICSKFEHINKLVLKTILSNISRHSSSMV